MTLEEISESQSVGVDFVRATLMTKSRVYRDIHKAKESKKEFISQEELFEMYENYKALARYTENDVVKEKCLSKLIDDGRGRLDKKEVEVKEVTNNIQIIQVMLDRAKANKEIVLGNPAPHLELEVV